MDGQSESDVPYSGVTDMWLRKHHQLHTAATRHLFLLSIRDGTVDLSDFKRWFAQEYIVVKALVPFVGSVLTKAYNKSGPNSSGDIEVISGGLAALQDEFPWFKQQATKLDVDLNHVVPEKPTQDLCRFLEDLMKPEVDYIVDLTAYWAFETVYQESFAHCLEEGSKTPPELQEACQRWGNEEFGEDCSAIRTIVDRHLEEAASERDPSATDSEDVVSKAEATYLRILELEVEFRNMAGGSGHY